MREPLITKNRRTPNLPTINELNRYITLGHHAAGWRHC
jgi:hypothetical protein